MRSSEDPIDTIYGMFSRSSKLRVDMAYDYEAPEIEIFHAIQTMIGAEIMIDVGANVGVYSVYSTKCKTIEKIIAIEASRQTKLELDLNLSMQKSDVVIFTVNAAVSNRASVMKFIEHGAMAGHNALADTAFIEPLVGSEIINIPTKKLDGIVSDRGRILAVKIDVEGHECEVLDGALELLQSSSGFLQIEIMSEEKLSIVTKKIECLGYEMIGWVKNDYYFLHQSFASIKCTIIEIIFREVRIALINLKDLNRKRRTAIRRCRDIGSAAKPVREVLSFPKDPVLSDRGS